jgi:MinD-like ATPase involved in chromosome partitioning or flagellar assembly
MDSILVHSYKGGAGKTIVSVNLANQLKEVYNKKILLIEIDFKMPSFFRNPFSKFLIIVSLNDI